MSRALCALTTVWLWTLAGTALGAEPAKTVTNPGEQLGKNFADTIQPALFWVWVTVLGIMAVGYLGARNISKFAVFAAVGVGVGIFVMSPEGVGHIVKSLGDSLANGV